MLAQRPTRIVGGKDAEKGLHPWQVSVHWGDRARKIPSRHICGGSLVTAGWILTAGHCKTLAPAIGEFHIFVGKYKLEAVEETEQSRLVNRIFVHPQYDGWVLQLGWQIFLRLWEIWKLTLCKNIQSILLKLHYFNCVYKNINLYEYS